MGAAGGDDRRLAAGRPAHGEEWCLPGSHLDPGEQPEAAAAREFAEEIGLTVAPDDLVLCEAVARQVIRGSHSLILLYAARREDTEGPLRAGDDAAAARFWTPGELADAPGSLRTIHEELADCREVEWWRRTASDALAAD